MINQREIEHQVAEIKELPAAGSSVKTAAKRKKSSARNNKNGDDPLITKDMGNYEEDQQDIGKTKRFF